MIGDGAEAETYLKWGKSAFVYSYFLFLFRYINCLYVFSLLGLISFHSLVGIKLICHFCGVYQENYKLRKDMGIKRNLEVLKV